MSFHYITSKENPADIASRGCTAEKLKDNNLWWHGPDWLRQPEALWPLNNVIIDQNEPDIESDTKTSSGKAEITVFCDESPSITNSPLDIDCERFSSVTKLIRITALALKFIQRLKRSTLQFKQLTADEMCSAEKLWILYVQRKHFGDLLKAIDKNRPHNLKNQLGVYKDENGFLKCKGRLEYADMSEAARNPILLPKNDKFTHLVIERAHQQLLHSGISQTLSQVRHRFWIPCGRATVRGVLSKCITCRKYEGGPYAMPKMPPIPKQRVMQSTPFSDVGVDYLGPLFVKTETEPRTVWVCLFTCMVTRALHLELMNDMSTDEFLLGLRRFIAQRGTPVEMISDNAAQFKLASDVVKKTLGNSYIG